MKRVIVILGLAGSGKTTAGKFLAGILGAPLFHPMKVAGHVIPAEMREKHRRSARLIPELVHPFLEAIEAEPSQAIVVDGFPRDIPALEATIQAANSNGWQLEIVYLKMPTAFGIGTTLLRQILRDVRKNKGPLLRTVRKLFRDITRTPGVVRAAAGMGTLVHQIDARMSLEAVQQQGRTALGLDLQTLPWDRDVLCILASVEPDAWVTGGGHIYRPFFNGAYGPITNSWDIDIRVWGARRADEVQHALERQAPMHHWHVKDAASWARTEFNRELADVKESFGLAPLICTCAGIRWHEGKVQVCWGHPEAEADLRSGLLRPNPNGKYSFAIQKARKIAEYYPGVSAPFVLHERVPIALTYADAMQEVQQHEFGGKGHWHGFTPREEQFAHEVIQLLEKLPRDARLVPWPPPAPLPDGDPWLSPDAQFRMWVVNQARSRNPAGGSNEYLRGALECQWDVQQKATHQGWDLHLHALHALLQLETDHVPAYRRPLRLAMLWHDIGKCWNIHTPGAHQATGAKMWRSRQLHPLAGLSREEEKLISSLITCHDIFGRIHRSLWDPDYKGALDPAAARSMLLDAGLPLATMVRLVKATYLADVGSVSLLRWLLPVAKPIEQMLLTDAASDELFKEATG